MAGQLPVLHLQSMHGHCVGHQCILRSQPSLRIPRVEGLSVSHLAYHQVEDFFLPPARTGRPSGRAGDQYGFSRHMAESPEAVALHASNDV
jgi:hypothetical protein